MQSAYEVCERSRPMDGVLNEVTNRLHRQEQGAPKLETVCGATYHVAEDHLRPAPLEQQAAVVCMKKCDQCFGEEERF